LDLGSRGARRRAVATTALVTSAWIFATALPPALAATTSGRAPNLVTGSAYLVAPANLIAGHYYESFPGTADFGLTIDGALALAATGHEDQALRKIVAFIGDDGKDPSGATVNDWTGIGTSYASGGAIGKEALLAEVVGDNPRDFGGHNLIAALDASVCKQPSTGGNTSCPAAGSYLNDTSVFDQALGILAQLRAGQKSDAAAPIAYLETLQSAHGSWPSLIPPGGGPDVDSTAMAVMALALAPGSHARADVLSGLAWIAGKQEHNGGFPSAGAESINSTGLAIQALTLHAGAYKARISAALRFLASEQNSNGGFDADAGQHGSNLRASTQAVGGAVGTSFGTLRRKLSPPPARTRHRSDRAGQRASGRQGSAGAARHGAKSHASAKPAVTSAGTLRRHARRAASPTRLRANRAADQSTALTSMPAFGMWPIVVAGILALIVGLLLSWRRPRRSPAESKQSPTAPRVRS
jgi:hypothetical protein